LSKIFFMLWIIMISIKTFARFILQEINKYEIDMKGVELFYISRMD
jgi:hypothetical protein